MQTLCSFLISRLDGAAGYIKLYMWPQMSQDGG